MTNQFDECELVLGLTEEEIVEASSPVPLPLRGIYFLIQDESIVYVGQSDDIGHRISFHRKEGKKMFDSVAEFPIPYDDLNEIEAECIVKFAPMYNRALPINSKWITMPTVKDRIGWFKRAILEKYMASRQFETTNGFYLRSDFDGLFNNSEV